LVRNTHVYGKDSFDVDQLQQMLGDWRENRQRTAKTDDPYEVILEAILPQYEERLYAMGAVDFDSLIHLPIQLLEKHPEVAEKITSRFTQIMVDEFQDTNRSQFQLVKLLMQPHHNLTVVGDDDQSIYGWRGAEIENILRFPQWFKNCKTVKLVRNYRCNPAILDLANAVITKNTDRHGKDLLAEKKVKTLNKPEFFEFESEEQEAERTLSEFQRLKKDGVAYHDMAVLYRSNSQGALLETFLRKEKIPYRISGGTAFFDRKEIKDILAYLRCAIYPSEVALRRIMNTPTRGVGPTTVEKLQGSNMGFVAACRKWRELGVPEKAGLALEGLLLSFTELQHDLVSSPSFSTSVKNYLQKIGYIRYLEEQSKSAEAFQKTRALVDIFCHVFDSYQKQEAKDPKQALIDFVENMELRDLPDDEEKDEVNLLTFHACKGLEFSHVFLLGVEEDLIPHRVLGSNISEERRLFYVAITRAKDRLYMSRAKKRNKNGRIVTTQRSRFLLEVKPSLFTVLEGGRPISENDRESLVASFLAKFNTP
jgi:superfamily I DNA/RNA helicase